MSKKIICDGCGVEITPPVPFSYRMRVDTQYVDKHGSVKHRSVFRTFDFCSEEHFYSNLDGLRGQGSQQPSTPKEVEPPEPQVDVEPQGPMGSDVESKPNVYTCDKCGRQFATELSLKVHVGIMHK